MRTKLIAALLTATVLCQPVYADKASNSLNVAFARDIETLDSYQASGREALVLARLLYDGLVSKNHDTGEFIPELATSYEFVSDTEIDFEIREGVTFHNGETLTPEDVAYTLNKVSSPDYNARYQVAVNWIEKAEVTGERTVRLTMKQPYPLALEMLAGNLPIYPQEYYEEVGPEGMTLNPIGTGPYKLSGQTQGVEFNFERFDDYYSGGQKEGASIQTLNFRVLPEQNTQYAELLSGGIDWIWNVPEDDVQRLSGRGNIKIESAPIMRFAYIGLNPGVENTPLADTKVRQAINHAINRTGIRDALVGPNFALINSPCNPIQFGCSTDVISYDYDLSQAKKLLAEAGYDGGFDLSMIVISNTMMPQAEAIAANLSEIGINVRLNLLQYAPAVDQWRTNKQDAYFATWGSYGIGDVGMSVAKFFSGTGDDVWMDSEVIDLVTEATSIVDQPRREELYAKALTKITEEAYWVPLWTFSMNTAMAKDLELSVDPDEFVPFWDATWN